jgi:hypothetical protein
MGCAPDAPASETTAMSIFDEREKSHERKFQLDQELAFKAKARRNKLFGLWAAERLGLVDEAAEAYAREVAAIDLGKTAEAVVARVTADLATRGVTPERVRAEFEHCAVVAKRQLGAPA